MRVYNSWTTIVRWVQFLFYTHHLKTPAEVCPRFITCTHTPWTSHGCVYIYIQRARFSAQRRPAIIFHHWCRAAANETTTQKLFLFFFTIIIIIIDFFLCRLRIISHRATVAVRARPNIYQQRSVKRIDASKSLNTPFRLFSRATKNAISFFWTCYIYLIVYKYILQQYIIYTGR